MEYPAPVDEFIKAIHASLGKDAVEVETEQTRAKYWWIDLRAKRHLAVEWRPDRGFGFSQSQVPVFGDGPSEVFTTAKRAAARVVQVLTKNEDQLLTDLSALRELYGLTQNDVAQKLHIGQPAISRLEEGRDSKIETIKEYVRALGGKVELRAVFSDGFLPIPLPKYEAKKPTATVKATKPRGP